MKSFLVAALAFFSLSAHAYTDSQGKEWRSLNQSLGYTADQAAQICNPVCSGNLVGYTWANGDEVAALFAEFVNGADMSDPITGHSIASNFVMQFGATWSLSLITAYYAQSSGMTSSVDANGVAIIGTAAHGTNGVGSGTSGSFSLGAVLDSQFPTGLFLYKSSEVVPTPAPTPNPTPAPICNKQCMKEKAKAEKEAAKRAEELEKARLKKEKEAAKKAR